MSSCFTNISFFAPSFFPSFSRSLHPGLSIAVGAVAALLALVLGWAAESPSGADMHGHPRVSIRPPHVAYTCKVHKMKHSNKSTGLTWTNNPRQSHAKACFFYLLRLQTRKHQTPQSRWNPQGGTAKTFQMLWERRLLRFFGHLRTSSRSEHKAVPWWQDRRLEGTPPLKLEGLLIGLIVEIQKWSCKINMHWHQLRVFLVDLVHWLRFLRLGWGVGIDLTSWISNELTTTLADAKFFMGEWKQMGESCFHSFFAWSALFNHFCTVSLCRTRSTLPGTNWWDTLRLH